MCSGENGRDGYLDMGVEISGSGNVSADGRAARQLTAAPVPVGIGTYVPMRSILDRSASRQSNRPVQYGGRVAGDAAPLVAIIADVHANEPAAFQHCAPK